MKMSKFRIAVLVLPLVTVAYVVALAYAEATPLPNKILHAYTGDIILRASEVSTQKEPYRRELENPNIYVKTAILGADGPYVSFFLKVPSTDDFQFENGVYHYNDHYYAIEKNTITSGGITANNAFWKSAVEQNLRRRYSFIFAGMLLAFGWAGVGTYSLKAGRRVKVFNAVTLTVAILIVTFLVKDIYTLQKDYEMISGALEYRRLTEEDYRRIMAKLDGIKARMNARVIALIFVVSFTAVLVLLSNKASEEKHICV